MKKIVLSIALVLLLAMTSVSFARANAVNVPVPLKGTLQAVETHVINFPMMAVDINGSGNATLLGLFSYHNASVVDLRTSSGTGKGQFVAANGDVLTGDMVGHAIPGPEIAYVTEWFTVTGGTGRFTGATGSLTIHRQENRATGVSSGDFDGTLVLQEGH